MDRGRLARAGISRREVDRLVDSGQLHRLRKGSFTISDRLAVDDELARHRLLVEDVARSVAGRAVVSHFSAAVLLDLPLPSGITLSSVHLTWPGASGRGRTSNITPHRSIIEDDDLTTVDGIAVTSAARTVYDLARSEDQLLSVSIADAALARDACTHADFDSVLERTRGRRGSVMAWQVMRFADGRAATDLHSRVRVVFARLGLPVPDLATSIGAPDPLGPIDFEFGRFRTVALVDPASDQRVKQLDDLERSLMAIGWRVCRVDESDVTSPVLLSRRMATAFRGAGTGRWGRRPPILVGAPKSIWQY